MWLRAAVPDASIKKLLVQPFVPLEAFEPEDAVQPNTGVRFVNHYMEKLVEATLTSSDGEVKLDEVLRLHRKASTKVSLQARPLEVQRFLRGKVASFSNTLVTVVRNREPEPKRLTLTEVFDSHQHGFLSDVQVRTEDGQPVPFTARYVSKLPKPLSNNPVTVVEVCLEVGAQGAVEVAHPYLVNFRMLGEYEQEYERGTYLLGALLFVHRDGDAPAEIFQLPPVQTNEKQIDSTFAFTTLSVNNIIFFILPISIMFMGVSINHQRQKLK